MHTSFEGRSLRQAINCINLIGFRLNNEHRVHMNNLTIAGFSLPAVSGFFLAGTLYVNYDR